MSEIFRSFLEFVRTMRTWMLPERTNGWVLRKEKKIFSRSVHKEYAARSTKMDGPLRPSLAWHPLWTTSQSRKQSNIPVVSMDPYVCKQVTFVLEFFSCKTIKTSDSRFYIWLLKQSECHPTAVIAFKFRDFVDEHVILQADIQSAANLAHTLSLFTFLFGCLFWPTNTFLRFSTVYLIIGIVGWIHRSFFIAITEPQINFIQHCRVIVIVAVFFFDFRFHGSVCVLSKKFKVNCESCVRRGAGESVMIGDQRSRNEASDHLVAVLPEGLQGTSKIIFFAFFSIRKRRRCLEGPT